jgi:hypothetical protein
LPASTPPARRWPRNSREACSAPGACAKQDTRAHAVVSPLSWHARAPKKKRGTRLQLCGAVDGAAQYVRDRVARRHVHAQPQRRRRVRVRVRVCIACGRRSAGGGDGGAVGDVDAPHNGQQQRRAGRQRELHGRKNCGAREARRARRGGKCQVLP